MNVGWGGLSQSQQFIGVVERKDRSQRGVQDRG